MAQTAAAKALQDKKVKVTYLDLPNGTSLGRGEVVRLFLNAHRVAFEDERVSMDAWPEIKKKVVADGRSPAGYLPIVEIGGHFYTEHIAVCRYIARQLGLYGNDAEKDYLVDKVTDAYHGWRNAWVAAAFFADEAGKAKHISEARPMYATVFDTFLSTSAKENGGPFVLGDQFSFADAALFQIIHDEGRHFAFKVDPSTHPHLAKFYNAVQKYPAVAEYLASPRRHEQPE